MNVKEQDIVRLFAIGVLAISFLGLLFVMIFDMIVRPTQMIPTLVTTAVGAVIGYASTLLGVQQGVNQTIATHLTLSKPPEVPSNDNSNSQPTS